MSALPRSIAIIGPGLLGGSIAQAWRRISPDSQLRIWGRRDEAVAAVHTRGLADFASTSIEEVCAGAELVVLCTPVETMEAQATQIANAALAENCVVTDVGSVKGPVVSALESVFLPRGIAFLGSHPMAGSERAGLDAARADLFQNATCILTPTLFTTDHALAFVRSFWLALGCRLQEMAPDEHDRKIARISHLPHLAAAAVTMAALHSDPSAASCVGNGFRDATRIAAGDPDLWTGILLQNRAEIVPALADARRAISELLAMLEEVDEKTLRRFLAEAKSLRDRVPASA